jgi:serine/threonine-protein phosphatase 5
MIRLSPLSPKITPANPLPSHRIFKIFSESFSALPLATLVGDKYLVLHGGLFSDDSITLDDIRKLDRHNQRQPGHSGLMMEMLWTDPQVEPGRGPSKRGVGLQFGPDITKRFCERNGLEAVIRSHEVRMDGYEVQHDGRCITGTVHVFLIPSPSSPLRGCRWPLVLLM